jgi:predicted dehydrogenase
VGPVHFVHGCYFQDWLLKPTDYSWRLEPEQGGASSAFADIGSHWCDLVQHVIGQQIVSVLADLTTVVATRYRPGGTREAFMDSIDGRGEPFEVRGEDLATLLVRFNGLAKGTVSIGQVCAGHKNDLRFEVNGATGSLAWRQERQNELWIGRRDEANAVLAKDPSLLTAEARPYAHLPGGHQEGWSDAFCNVLRDIYSAVQQRMAGESIASRPPAFATFEDGYRVARLVDAVLESHRRGGAWIEVSEPVLAGSGR